jgi:hypothetical protein
MYILAAEPSILPLPTGNLKFPKNTYKVLLGMRNISGLSLVIIFPLQMETQNIIKEKCFPLKVRLCFPHRNPTFFVC